MKDPIVEEVHRARRELWDDCNGDLQKMLEKLKAIESEEKHRVVSFNDQRAEESQAFPLSDVKKNPRY